MSRALLFASAVAAIALCALPAGAQGGAADAEAAPDEGAPAEATASEATPGDTAPVEPPAETADAAQAADAQSDEAADESSPASAPLRRPKVTVVVVGDADDELRAAALEVEAALSAGAEVRLPADVGLRAALRGETSSAEDGIEDVRVERRRLGRGEAQDAPILAQLGTRAGAVAVVVVRASASGPEALVLDVRAAQFFDGALALDGEASISSFVARRARSAARGAVSATAEAAAETVSAESPAQGPTPTTAPEAATEVTPEDTGPQDAGQWFEQNWPYFAAGALLAAAIVFVVVTATQDGPPPPMLRFQAGP